MPRSFQATLDTRAQTAFLKRYRPDEVERALLAASAIGARAAVPVLRGAAPVGRSDRPSPYYRRNGLGHGTFRASIRAAKIRGRRAGLRDLQKRTVGHVIGPIGKNAFTRAWLEFGTNGPGRHRQRGLHWLAGIEDQAFSVARSASDASLAAYARQIR